MKSVVFFFVTLAVLISVVAALPTFSFTGSTQIDQPNVGQYPGVDLYEDPCTTYDDGEDDYYYNFVAWNIWIDSSNASYYFVKGQATNNTYYDDDDVNFYVYIYNTTFDYTNPCQGLYANGEFESYIDYVNVFDAVWLGPGLYTLVVTTSDDEAVFGLEFTPATVVLPLWGDIGLPTYADDSGPAYYYQDYEENLNCSYDEYDEQLVYNNFTWTQSSSGYFDFFAIIVNSTLINPSTDEYYDVYISLYSGWLAAAADFQSNPCQANFINGYEEGEVVTGLDYIWLNAGWNYTLVVSAEIYGSVAVQVLPSNFVFLNNASFAPPDEDDDDEECTTEGDEDGDDDEDDYLTGWTSLTFTAWYPVFVVADIEPINTDYWGSFDSYLLLYSGNLNGNPPIACTGLLQQSGYSLGGPVQSGVNYTVLVIDYDEDDYTRPYDESASHLYIFTGAYVNTASYVVPPSTGFISTSSSSTATSASSSTSSSTSSTSSTSSSTVTSSTATVSTGSSSSTVTTGLVNGTTTGKGTTTGLKPTTGSTGVKPGTTGVKGTAGTTGAENASNASSAFVSAFVFLLVTFALFF